MSDGCQNEFIRVCHDNGVDLRLYSEISSPGFKAFRRIVEGRQKRRRPSNFCSETFGKKE